MRDGMKLEGMSIQNKSDVYTKVGCVLSDMIEASRLVVRLKSLISSYDRVCGEAADPVSMNRASMEQISVLMDSEYSQVYLLDERREVLYTKDEEGRPSTRHWTEGLMGAVCTTRKSVRVEDVGRDSRYDRERDGPKKRMLVKSMMCVPINELVSQKTYGRVA